MYLGIDLGTSGVKLVLVDEDQRLVAEQSSPPLSISRPARNWSEQHPDLWWEAVEGTIDALAAAHPGKVAAIRGIGLSGQMYGASVLDAADRPLRPAILWNDTRSARECAEMEAREPALVQIAGRHATPGATAPKMLWLRRHEREIFDATRTVLLPKDYIRLRLSGDKASDKADASGTLWMDLGRRDWSEALLGAGEMRLDQMPRLYEGIEATGQLRADLAARWGMARRPVIAAGGGDNACGACGVGAIRDGDGTVSLGTSGVLFLANATPRQSSAHATESLCHSVPGTWHQMSVILSATSCLTWLSRLLKRPAADLVMDLGEAPLPPTQVQFLPFLDGCWSPRMDPEMRGALHNLEHATDDRALTQAVLQGVVFALADCAAAFRETGATMERLLAIGGGSRSKLWLSMIANTLDVDLAVPMSSELGAAFGAARLARLATTGEDPADVLTPPEIRDAIEPEPGLAADYAAAWAEWRQLLPPRPDPHRALHYAA
jgi:xylulokinase